jgi:hypothetical protein
MKNKKQFYKNFNKFQEKILKSIEPDLKAMLFPPLNKYWRELINEK